MKRTIYLLVILISVAAACGAQCGEGLVADVLPHEITICKDEPLILTFIATNLTTGTIEMEVHPNCFWFRIMPIGGPENNYAFYTRWELTVAGYCAISPGETVKIFVPFPHFMGEAEPWDMAESRYCDVNLAPGDYEVSWEVESNLPCIRPPQPPIQGSLRIKLLPRNQNRLLESYRALVRRLSNVPVSQERYNGSLAPRILLYRIRDPQAVPIIAELLENQDDSPRLYGINALRGIVTPESIEILEDYRKNRNLSPDDDYYVSKCIEGMQNRLKNK